MFVSSLLAHLIESHPHLLRRRFGEELAVGEESEISVVAHEVDRVFIRPISDPRPAVHTRGIEVCSCQERGE